MTVVDHGPNVSEWARLETWSRRWRRGLAVCARSPSTGYRFHRDDAQFGEEVAQESLSRADVAWPRVHDHPNLEAWITVTAWRVSMQVDRQQRRSCRGASRLALMFASEPERRLFGAVFWPACCRSSLIFEIRIMNEQCPPW